MPTFTPKEITRALCIGIGGLLLGTAMTITGVICLRKGLGTPEYIESLRNTGWTLIALSTLWTALATYRKLTTH
jgi:hypothetical protein